ncbi:pyridoxamine 5'-phosphate oxidase family protein [Streptomyces oceani]|uniref:Pyridoxamine 5'-phosphate oxidase n=1 Tax=Streptomyces oceani TaxID=1075402 RepID=A0A1E7KFL8_9ACTN|nr:pyridoxamine 5'-phosphate oxidase family protein [Streptomyces oceani]OEV02720.1 pyridoxamine 5'-phosphate oxidase [Streptomyces oceani]
MTLDSAARTRTQRKQEVLERLRTEHDVWVASADAEGTPCLVPLSLYWDGTAIWLATRETNPTGRNLRTGRSTRLSFPDTHDAVLLDGGVETFTKRDIDEATADAFAARCGWEPRRSAARGVVGDYVYFRVTLTAVQAFRGLHEMPERHLMREGEWLV